MVGRIFIFILVLAVALALLLTTCHIPETGGESATTSGPAPAPPEEPEPAPPEEPAPAPPEDLTPEQPEEPEPELPEEPESEEPEELEPEEPELPDELEEPEPEEEPEPAEEPATTAPEEPSDDDGSIAHIARGLIGSPFLAGGATPAGGFDNSGFIYYVLNSYGIRCPRRTQEQALMGQRISDFADLISGDLVFFGSTPGDNRAVFGGIYVGGGNMVFVSNSAATVIESDITQEWFKNIFVAGARVELGE